MLAHNVPALMTRDQYNDWIASLPPDECTFCEWRRYQVVLTATKHWLWILNRAPYWPYHTMLVPKAHRESMEELSVVETGELFVIHKMALEVLAKFQQYLPPEQQSKNFIFFWRMRNVFVERATGHRKFAHFHLHLSPDREGLFDPLLSPEAHQVDPIPLINLSANSGT